MPGASASKNIYGTASSYPYVLKVSFKETATSVANNTSVISISGSLYGQYVSWSSNYNSYLDIYWHDNRTNKNILVATSDAFTGNAMGQTRSVSKSITVTHNADGKLSGFAAIQFRAGSTSGGWSPPSTWLQTASTALTSIARASSISSLQGSVLGSAVIVGISRASSSFTHEVEYSYAESGWISVSTSAATSASFTPPVSLASQVPNATTGSLTVRVITMNGSTQVGSAVTKSINLSIPTSIVPTIGSATAARVDNGVPSDWGVYVVGFSQVEITFSASGASGSTIESNSISGPGIIANSNSATSSTFTVAGTKTYTCKTTDSRGRSATKSVSVIVVDYSNPSISVSAIRCNSDGTASANGTYLKVTCNYSIASVSGKNSVASRSVTCNGVSNTTFSSGAAFVLAAKCSIGSKYTLTATIKDALGKTATATIEIQTAERVMNVKANKKGIAFGKFAERDGYLEVAYKMLLENTFCMLTSGRIRQPLFMVSGSANGDGVVLGNSGGVVVLSSGKAYNSYINNVGAIDVTKKSAYVLCDDDLRIITGLQDPANRKSVYVYSNGVVEIPSTLHAASHVISNGGYLYSRANGKEIKIGSENASYCHYITTASTHWFNTQVYIAGALQVEGKLAAGTILHPTGAEWIGFYSSNANAYTNTKRKTYIGPNGTTNFYIQNEAGGSCIVNKAWSVGSDKRLKKDIKDIADVYVDIWKELNPKTFKWNDINYGTDKNEFGLIAQDVIAAFEKHNLDYRDYSLITQFKIGTPDNEDEVKENSDITKDITEYFSLSYDHYFMMTAQVVKKQQEEIDTLKQEVSELKELVKQLLGKEVS